MLRSSGLDDVCCLRDLRTSRRHRRRASRHLRYCLALASYVAKLHGYAGPDAARCCFVIAHAICPSSSLAVCKLVAYLSWYGNIGRL